MFWIAILAAVHMVAAVVLTDRFWKPSRRSDYAATVVLTALTTFYGFPIILGYTTTYMNTWVIIGAALVTVSLASIARRHATGDASFLPLVRAIRQLGVAEWIGWAIICFLLLATLVVGSMFPIRTWDAAAYHSLTPMAWAQSHRFRLHSYGDPTLYPYLGAGEVYANVKAVLPYLVLDWTGSLDGTALAQWPFFAAIPMVLLAIFRRAGLPRHLVPLGALFIMLAPEVLLQSVEAYADIVFLAATMFVVWACLVVWGDGPSLRPMLLGAFAFAQLAGSKPTGLPAGAALGIVYLVIVFLCAVPYNVAMLPVRLRRAGIALAIVLGACLLIAGPWYLHALIRFHNPVYPIRVSFGNDVIFPGPYLSTFNTDYAERYSKASGLAAWWRVMTDAWRPHLLASWSGGLGLHTAALGFPAIAMFLALGIRGTWWRERLVLVVLCVAMVISCQALTLGRFILFLLPYGAFAFSWLLDYTTALPRRALMGFAATCLLFDFYATAPSILYRARPAELVGYNLLSGDRRALRDDSFPDEFSAMDYWREHAAKPGTKLALPAEHSPWSAFAPRSGADYIRLADPKTSETAQRWIDELRKAGVTHVFAPRKSENYRVARADSSHFHLLFQNLDSGAESRLWLEPKPEAALFEFKP